MANELTGLINKINSAIRSDKNLRTALITTLAVHKPRIFAQGLDAKGAKIGKYSTKPISISTKNQAKKTGQTYFKGGYSQYKSAIGRNPGYVILRNTDQMQMDYGLKGSNLDYGFGFVNKFNYDKSQWMQTKYDKDIFDLANNEADVLANTLQAIILRAI